MNTELMVGYAKGRLFQLMVLAITVGVILLGGISTYLTVRSFQSLSDDVAHTLQSGQQKVQETLDLNLAQVADSVRTTEQNTNKILSSYLQNSVEGELEITEQTLRTALTETSGALADMLAAVAAEPILAKNFSTLIDYVKVANRNQRKVYAVYYRPDGRPYTRYINRKKPAGEGTAGQR